MMLRNTDLLEYSPDGIVLHDGERIVAANAAMLRLAGADRVEQVVGRSVSAIFEHPHLKCVERQLIAGQPMPDAPVFVRDRVYSLDGRVHDVDAHAKLFLENGRLTVMLVLHDIGAQVAAERRLYEQYELAREAASRADARQVAAGVAHVLNNRLQIILGFANLLAEEVLSRDQRLDLEQIIHAALEGADVTRQLLQSAGSATCVPELTSLTELVATVMRPWQATSGGRERPVQVDVAPAPRVRVDPAHIGYMLAYLLDNARRATRERGRIDVRVNTVVLQTAQLASQGQRMEPGRYATITVEDTGVGIAPYAQFHMFEPFFTTARIGEGNGLGLSAVQGLLRQNGGFLTFVSTPGGGSTFTLWFPEDGAAVRDAPEVARGAVLVVDSEVVTRSQTVRSLERVGYRVLQAATALEASEVLAHVECPALIITGPSVGRRAAAALTRLRAHCPAVPLLMLVDEKVRTPPSSRSAPADFGGLTSRLTMPYSDFVLVSRVRALIGERV